MGEGDLSNGGWFWNGGELIPLYGPWSSPPSAKFLKWDIETMNTVKELLNYSTNEVKHIDIHHITDCYFGVVNSMQDKAGIFWRCHQSTTSCSWKMRMSNDTV